MFSQVRIILFILSLSLLGQGCSHQFFQSSLRQVAQVNEAQYSYHPKGNIVAIGDVHGDPESFIDALIGAGILNKKGKFVGKDVDLVLLGDFANKGHNTLGVWNIIHYLEEQSKAHNSRVHAVFGNHDTVLMMGDTTRMKPKDLENFLQFDANPEKGLKKALSSEPYKSMMARWKGMVRIGENVFVHGGLDDWILDTTPEEINKIVHDYVLKQQEYIKASLSDPKAIPPEVPWVIKPWKFDSNTPLPDNPFWSRQMSTKKLKKKQIKKILEHIGAIRMIVGHTPTRSKEIEDIYQGRVIKADTGNSRAFKKGKVSAVKIKKNGKVEYLNGIKRGKYPKAYKKVFKKAAALCGELLQPFLN